MELAKIQEYIPEHYSTMLEVINKNLPHIEKTTKNFGKTYSQYQNCTVNLADLTPIRRLRSILAEIEKSYLALKEIKFKRDKQVLSIQIKQADSLNPDLHELSVRMLNLEIDEIRSQLETNELYLSGSIRRITAYIEQYNSISEKFNIKNFTEKDFEADEEKHHIMTAFSQALTAARARNGVIDEGNHIYFMTIGINGAIAQKRITDYLYSEQQNIDTCVTPSYEDIIKFLEQMATEFKGSSYKMIKDRGFLDISTTALLN